MISIVCKLPWPPSANHAWRPTKNGGKILSDKYKSFKQAVGDCVLEQRVKRHWHSDQKLIIGIACRAPNLQSFDIDNRIKTLIDALAGAGVIANDKHIDMIIVRRASLDPPHGSVTVRIEQLVHCVAEQQTLAQFRLLNDFNQWFVGMNEHATAAA